MTKYVSIKVKISTFFIALIVILILTSSGVSYFEFNRIYRDRVMDDLNQIMVQNTMNMNNLVASVDEATLVLFNDRTISNALNQNTSNFVSNYQYQQTILQQVVSSINIPLSQTLTAYGVSFFASGLTPLSTHLSSADLGINGVFSSDAVARERWYVQTVKSDGALYWFHSPAFMNRLYVARLIKDPSTNKDLGVVVLYFNTSQISRQLNPSLLMKSAQALILNAQGRILYSQASMASEQLAKKEYADTVNGPLNGATYTVAYRGKQYVYTEHSLSNGWQLIELIPLSFITAQIAVVKYIIWTTTGIAVLSGIALSLFLSVRISRPIIELARIMGRIDHPQSLQVHMVPPGHDEVSILYASFNKLMNRMTGLMTEVYHSGVKEKESELKALQAQINPHFLYNTLDSVNWIALGIGADQITTMISSLANILRYSIKDPDHLVSVSEELGQVVNYLNIQMLCYDHRFDVEYDFEPESMGFMTPKLILQPLVENSIQHGIEKMNERGKIQIRGQVEEDRVILWVSNSGNGTDVNRINDYLNGYQSLSRESRGYGIKNVDQRIKLLFGSEFGLRYKSNDDGGVTAIITLPTSIRDGNREYPGTYAAVK